MGILGELWVKLGLKNDELKKGLNESKREVNGFAGIMKKLGGTLASVFAVEKVLRFTHETAELANKARGVRAAFDRLNQPNLLANLRKATAGTVDDLQLMQTAIQANNFKIPLDQLATYLKFATMEAQRTGKAADYLVESIILGLGRQSVAILDNLGFSAAEIKEQMKGGASMAEAVSNIIKERMPDATAEIDKAASASERLTAAWTNFKMMLGETTSGPINWIKDQLAGALEERTNIQNSGNLNKWQKFFSRNFILRGIMRAAGTYDRAFAQDAADAELIGPVQSTNTPAATTDEETVAVKGLVQKLQEEIAAKEKIRDLSLNEDEVRKTNDEIEALKEKLKLLQMTSEEYAKHQASLDTSVKKVEGIFDVPKIQANTNAGMEALNAGMEAWRAGNERAVAQQAAMLEGVAMMNEAINTGITNSLGELANAIAGVEGADVGSVVKALLSPLADAAIAAGLLIMTTGEGIQALKASLIDFFGGSAIAAGAALMAVGVAAKAGLASIGRNGARGASGYNMGNSTSYSGGYGVNAASYSPSASNFTLTTKLQGQDLLLAIQRTQANNKR